MVGRRKACGRICYLPETRCFSWKLVTIVFELGPCGQTVYSQCLIMDYIDLKLFQCGTLTLILQIQTGECRQRTKIEPPLWPEDSEEAWRVCKMVTKRSQVRALNTTKRERDCMRKAKCLFAGGLNANERRRTFPVWVGDESNAGEVGSTKILCRFAPPASTNQSALF